MQKKLLFNIALLLLINLLVKPFWILGIDRSVQNIVGYEQYGLYANMFSIAMILSMLLDFGINNFNSSTIANNPGKLQTQFSSLFSLKIILSAIYLLLTFLIAYLYGYRNWQLGLIGILSFNQVIAHFNTFIRSNISGLQLFRTDAWLSAADRFVMIWLGLAMIAGSWFSVSITHFIYIQSVGYVSVLLLSSFVLSRYLTQFSIRFNKMLILDLLKKTYPYALLALIMLLYSRLDVLMIKKLYPNGDHENGVYASSGRLLEATNMMIGAITVILLPFFARMLSSKEDITPISKLLSAVILIPVMYFAIGCHTYADEIMQLLSPNSSAYTAQVFSVLILCFIPYSFMYMFGSMLTAKAEMKLLNSICAVALVINIVVNVLLIPVYGAWGAAITALITQILVGFGKFFFAIKRIRLTHPATHYIKLFVFPLLVFAGFKLIHALALSILSGFAIMLLFMCIWIVLLKMIETDKIKALITSYVKAKTIR